MEIKIEELIQKNFFSYVDYYFAHSFLKNRTSEERDNLSFLFCYLLKIARQGHLCLHIDEGKIHPSPSAFTSNVEESSFLEKQIINGSLNLPSLFFHDVILERNTPLLKPICKVNNSLYLQKNWLLETHFLYHLNRLLEGRFNMTMKESICLSPLLNNRQKEAVLCSLNSSISLITGGPGTGKTFTAVEIIKTFLLTLSSQERSSIIIKVAAPTGKAAAHLEKNLTKYLGSLEGIECGTLHALLKVHPRETMYHSKSMIFADLFLIDEASMIDAKLFVRLLSSMRNGGRLVLMGDENQLPPIESGGFFSDLIQISSKLGIPCTLLKDCLRVEKKELLDFAESILKGEEDRVFNSCFTKTFVSSQIQEVKEHLWSQSQLFFNWPVSEGFDFKHALGLMDRFRILTSLRKGPLGVDNLNEMILYRFIEQKDPDTLFAVPILIISNDYSLQLMNGDMGVLVAKVSSLKKGVLKPGDKAYFLSKEEGKDLRMLSGSILPVFEFGYALSIHKSQGSEYDSVIALIPSGSEDFGKEVLYTAVTRAKKELVLMGESTTISGLLKVSSRKNSGVNQLISSEKR